MQKIAIVKRDGSKEEWNVDKLIASMIKAGTNSENSQNVASQIKEEVEKSGKEQISSVSVRDMVIKKLSKVDSLSAQTYKDYKKS